MTATRADRRLFVLSLDGLSWHNFATLAAQVSALRQLWQRGSAVIIDCTPMTAAQPIWAEILSGLSWAELGCPGYARPGHSINAPTVPSEADLGLPLRLVDMPEGELIVVINMPLVRPGPGRRIWLSDGSMPDQMAVCPAELGTREPFASYRSRPFVSTAAALGDTTAAVRSLLSVERRRLQCASELARSQPWRLFFLRVSAFDLIAHLLGCEYLDLGEELALWPEIAAFLAFFDHVLKEIEAIINGAHVCLLSAFSHGSCRATCNLNAILAEGGFLACARDGTPDARTLLRLSAVQAIGSVTGQRLPTFAPERRIDPAATVAASPSAGAIYLNLKSRFLTGTVSEQDAPEILKAVINYLEQRLGKEFGPDVHIWAGPHGRDLALDEEARLPVEGKVKAVAPFPAGSCHLLSPDLVLYIEGVEFISGETPVVDRYTRPRSTHRPAGFAVLPQRGTSQLPCLKPIQLHEVLWRLCR